MKAQVAEAAAAACPSPGWAQALALQQGFQTALGTGG